VVGYTGEGWHKKQIKNKGYRIEVEEGSLLFKIIELQSLSPTFAKATVGRPNP